MNTTLSAPPGRHDQPQPHIPTHRPAHVADPVSATDIASRQPLRRVGLADRIALHVGIALITWSRRPLAPRDRRGRLVARAAQRRERDLRERAWERRHRLMTPSG